MVIDDISNFSIGNIDFLLEKCEDGYWGFSCENSCPCGRNDKGEVIETSLEDNFKDIKGFKVETRTYEGCPKFQTSSAKDNFLDDSKDEFLD